LKDITNVLIVGVGGQGTILASDILVEAAVRAGHDAKKSEIHGMSQRGGSVFSHVRFGSKVYSPVIPRGGSDFLVSLEEMETLRWQPFLNKNTRLILSTTRILPPNAAVYPEGIIDALKAEFAQTSVVDADALALEAGNKQVSNVILLGALAAHLDFPNEVWKETLQQCVPQGLFDINWAAFEKGRASGA
jgi:indolepyruvate ferredoxin oxidoreductase, beta subunit